MQYTHQQAALREKFQHLEEFEKLVASIGTVAVSGDNIAVETLYERCLFIVDEYQEQPHLLDPHLENLLGKLLAYVRNEESKFEVIHLAFKIMYFITKARGYKVIVRLMPHEVADMEPVLALLGHESTAQIQNWESRYMLLLWLSIVCMIPFDMVKLDNVNATEKKKPVIERVIEVGKLYLNAKDKSSDAAAYMLSKFMTRPDVKSSHLPPFLDWAMQVLHNNDMASFKSQRTVLGVMSMLALLFKHGKREDLLPFSSVILKEVTALKLEDSKNSSLRKFGMKMVQRIALTFLKARVASWRYQRGSRSIAGNLSQEKSAMNTPAQALAAEGEEDYEIPDEMEDVIEQLLTGLRDNNTVVRWSAAKGIGRITGRLPEELADEVVGSIMELFTLVETDMAWHGGCLALAELGRRGLLLPQRLQDVVRVIIKALNFDEKRGHFSVGAHVRNAACYVCWAFARAYEPSDMKPYVEDIARALVIVTIFDREITVRGAASAAFQENVGRQGQFPHGIDILTTCDFFSVGNISNCYLELSHFVGGFPEYTEALINHLCYEKSSHWDEDIRELSAQALNKLVSRAPDYLASLLPEMIQLTMSLDLNVRHGAVLMTAWVISALSEVAAERKITPEEMMGKECLNQLKDLVPKYYDTKFFRGTGGELMRKAVCCLIDKASYAKLPFKDDPVLDVWQKFIDECIGHIEGPVQKSAVAAIPGFFEAYYQEEGGAPKQKVQENILACYLKGLKNEVETIRMGYALAIGALPKFFVHGHFQDICSALIEASVVQKKEVKFAEARRDAVLALTSLCSTVGVNDGSSSETLSSITIPLVYDALFQALNDYTLDSRGDVGSWVREASMLALKEITVMIVQKDPTLLNPDWCKRIFLSLVQQACEKIDRTRALAGETLISLLYHDLEIPHVPDREELKKILSKEATKEVNWSVPAATFPLFIEMLRLPTYAYSVMLGVTISVGGLTESLVRHSSASLTNYICQNITDVKHCEEFAGILLKICSDHVKVDRVIIPMMKMLDQLLSNGSFTPLAENEDPDFATETLAMCKREIARSGDPQKLLACIDVCCGLLQFSGNVRNKTISQLLIFLCHRYPIVRKNAANTFYETVILYDGVIPDDKIDDVMNILSETLWDEPVEQIRPVRNQLCDIFGVPVPVPKSKTTQ